MANELVGLLSPAIWKPVDATTDRVHVQYAHYSTALTS